MTTTMLQAVARVHWGRWIADCPRPGCVNAEHHGRDAVTGHVGGLTGGRFRCAHCLLVCEVVWPADVDDISRVLASRPVPANRNWAPPETVHDLLVENLVHGILPDADALGGGFQVSGAARLALESGVI
ncbi:hypothetical protein O7598_31060 [Micromonospora sp. WMMC241]|uniref:hypothetical protein n=1 Tax=Micromonospora sp. WMMC241 TaxID=3015159 RepID=UPI0022B6ADE1|nr:hypothetical protein [Micromonospora sp. WMMC241]MCZ7440808.1 hypothetical protein [Micromonospora sp. WMMC241]MCZ7440865.1 hypothetical protein [Micromonospora sp. WMMC241]